MFTMDFQHRDSIVAAIDALESLIGNPYVADSQKAEEAADRLRGDVLRESLYAFACVLGFFMWEPEWSDDRENVRTRIMPGEAWVYSEPAKGRWDGCGVHAVYCVEDRRQAFTLAEMLRDAGAIDFFDGGFCTDQGWASILYVDDNGNRQNMTETLYYAMEDAQD